MQSKRLMLLSVLIVAFGASAQAATTVTFESLQDSDPVGTVDGATFIGATVATAGVSLNEFEVPPHSGVNVALNSESTMAVTFAGGANVVSGFLTYAVPLTVKIFNGNDLVGSYTTAYGSNLALSGDPNSSPNEAFSLSSSFLFTSVEFVAISSFAFALDDLSFEATGVPVPSVPEPAQWTLLLVGVLALAGKSMRRSRIGIAALAGLGLLVGVSANAQSVLPTPSAYPQTVPTGAPVTVTVALRIDDPTFIAGSAVLNEVDASNRIIRRIGTLSDNGQGGDEVAGDKRYTGQLVVNEPSFREMRVAVSVAFTGILARTSSPPVVISAVPGTDLRSGLATLQDDKIVFRDQSGRATSSIPLARYDVAAVSLPSGPAEKRTLDSAFSSEAQSRVGVITSSVTTLIGALEGANDPSRFVYYGPSGVSLFSLQSSDTTTFFVDAQTRYASRSGDRVIVIEVSENETHPVIHFLTDTGTQLAKYANLPGIDAISEAQITTNGRFIGVIGEGLSGVERRISLIVIDTSTGIFTQRLFDPDVIPSLGLGENSAGSFNVLMADSVGEQLP